LKTPKAPDPVATAQAQSGLNTDTALTQQLVNQTNQVGPWGSTMYNATGSQSYTDSQGRTVSIPQFTQTTTYSPEQQAIFDKTTSAQTNLADIASQQSGKLKDYLNSGFQFDGGNTFNPSSVPTPGTFNAPAGQSSVGAFNAPQASSYGAFNSGLGGQFQTQDFNSGVAPAQAQQFNFGQSPYQSQQFDYGQSPFSSQDFAFNNQDAVNWSTDLASQRILPQQQQDRAALETQLTNKGIRPGTTAWDRELTRLGQTQNDQLNQLALNGRSQAYGEAFGTAQQNYNQNLGNRQQNYNEAFGTNQANNATSLAARGQNYNEAFGTSQANNANNLAAQGQNFNQALGTAQQNYTQALGGRQQNYNEALGAQQQNYNQFAGDQSRVFNQALAGQQQNYNQATTDQTNAYQQQLGGFTANTNTAMAAQQAQYAQSLGARQQNYQEAVTGRNQPLNEISSLLSGSQIANPNQGFSAAPQAQVGGVDYTGLVNQQYQGQLQQSQGAMGGIFGLAGSLGSAGILR
jgi:hypothetical protein